MQNIQLWGASKRNSGHTKWGDRRRFDSRAGKGVKRPSGEGGRDQAAATGVAPGKAAGGEIQDRRTHAQRRSQAVCLGRAAHLAQQARQLPTHANVTCRRHMPTSRANVTCRRSIPPSHAGARCLHCSTRIYSRRTHLGVRSAA